MRGRAAAHKRRGSPVPAAGALALSVFVALTPASGDARQQSPKSALVGEDRALLKISSHLLTARRLVAQGQSPQQLAAALPVLRFEGGRPEIEVRLHQLNPPMVEAAREAGMEISSISYAHARLYGLLDPGHLEELVAAIPEIATIHPHYGGQTRTGSTTSQGDGSVRADVARTTFGVDGSGVTVGILSDSLNNTLGGTVTGTPPCSQSVAGMTNQTSMDLPASVGLVKDLAAGGSDEGAALGEVIHDLAPGTVLTFRTAAVSEADYSTGITELVGCGVDVLVDDFGYFAEPMFQDGIVGQAAQDAVDAGVAFLSAAGNDSTFGVDDLYIDSNPGADDQRFPPPPSGDDLHDFDPGAGADRFAAITLPADCGIRAVLQWNQPFFGPLGPGSALDLDLYLFDGPSVGTTMLASSNTAQGCSPAFPAGDPLEMVTYTNNSGADETVYLAVEHFCGSEDLQLRVATFATGAGCGFPGAYTFEAGIFEDAQIYGHTAAAGVSSVGAAYYRDIDDAAPPPFAPPSSVPVEPFSSRGGDLDFYFDGSGNPLDGGDPVPRFKPELAGPDGVNTTFFGAADPAGDPCCEGDDFPNFFGTSAAAPHAAALAALMLELGNLSPSGIEQVLAHGAWDIDLTGRDDRAGYGLVDAVSAIGTTAPTASQCYVDDLVLTGKPNKPATGTINQVFRACDSLTLGGGDFTGVEGHAPLLIFTDGFESGDVSTWSNSVP